MSHVKKWSRGKCPNCGAVISSSIKPVKCPACKAPWRGSNPMPESPGRRLFKTVEKQLHDLVYRNYLTPKSPLRIETLMTLSSSKTLKLTEPSVLDDFITNIETYSLGMLKPDRRREWGYFRLSKSWYEKFLGLKNPFPAKMTAARSFGGTPYYYAGRTIYPSKARVVAQELREEGIDTKITQSKGAGALLWTSRPRYVDLEEPIR